MAEITKVLIDDHLRVKRLINSYEANPGRADIALQICDELRMHATVEEEIFYPALRDAVDERAADELEDEHAQVDELIAEIEEMEPGDPRLDRAIRVLKTAFLAHAEKEERQIFPKANTAMAVDLLDMGREAFARRQELLAERMEDSGYRRDLVGMANTGWRGRPHLKGGTANTGW